MLQPPANTHLVQYLFCTSILATVEGILVCIITMCVASHIGSYVAFSFTRRCSFSSSGGRRITLTLLTTPSPSAKLCPQCLQLITRLDIFLMTNNNEWRYIIISVHMDYRCQCFFELERCGGAEPAYGRQGAAGAWPARPNEAGRP
eukprot:scaffold100433_cov33-Prasinocladus_malaysianus.AAC.1